MFKLPKIKLLDERVIIHESLPIACLLAMAGGFLDAYTYLFHGAVFASMQSGNVILLGLNLAQGNFSAIGHYLPPILLFVLGILTTNVLKHRFPTGKWFVWQNAAVLMEAAGIFIVGFYSDIDNNLLINSSLAFFAAIQYATYRRLAGLPYASTMTTGNLRSIADYIYQYFFYKDPTASFKIKYTSLVVLFFFGGAVVSTLSAKVIHGKSIWVVSLILIAVLLVTLQNQKNATKV